MTPLRLMIDGVLLSEGETPVIPLDDGFVRGDGVFEGMRLYDHVPRTLDAHLDRMEDARRYAAMLRALVPGITIARIRGGQPARDPARIEPVLAGLRRAGLPED